MSILVDTDIIAAMSDGSIVIEPFNRDNLGTNSYDVTLAPTLRTYKRVYEKHLYSLLPLDVRVKPETDDWPIPPEGFVLVPGELYLASTIEYTETHRCVPILNGKSSLGRLGLSIHVTAGTGDVGFCNHWTLEMTVVKPLRIYAGMKIGQLLYFEASSEPIFAYDKKPGAKYHGRDALPGASLMHLNFDEKSE